MLMQHQKLEVTNYVSFLLCKYNFLSFLEDLIEETKNRNIFAKKLDLSSLKSIRKFAEHINATEERLDVLIHNAGMGSTKLEKTEDDLELTMATNHFGPFLLTHLLIGN